MSQDPVDLLSASHFAFKFLYKLSPERCAKAIGAENNAQTLRLKNGLLSPLSLRVGLVLLWELLTLLGRPHPDLRALLLHKIPGETGMTARSYWGRMMVPLFKSFLVSSSPRSRNIGNFFILKTHSPEFSQRVGEDIRANFAFVDFIALPSSSSSSSSSFTTKPQLKAKAKSVGGKVASVTSSEEVDKTRAEEEERDTKDDRETKRNAKIKQVFDQVNQTIEQNTGGHIKQFLSPDLVAAMQEAKSGVAIVGYLFLDSEFVNPFEEEDSELDAPFYLDGKSPPASSSSASSTSSSTPIGGKGAQQDGIFVDLTKGRGNVARVKMLHNRGTYEFYRKFEQKATSKTASTGSGQIQQDPGNIGFEILEMENKEPFQNLLLGFILPAPGQNLCDFFRTFSRNGGVSFYTSFMKQAKKRKIDVSLPEFDLHYKYRKLVPFLKWMRLKSPFESSGGEASKHPEADLTVTSASQEVFLKVHAKGFTAGAATAISILPTMAAPNFAPTPWFLANRPFIVYVRERNTNQILLQGFFTGRVKSKATAGATPGRLQEKLSQTETETETDTESESDGELKGKEKEKEKEKDLGEPSYVQVNSTRVPVQSIFETHPTIPIPPYSKLYIFQPTPIPWSFPLSCPSGWIPKALEDEEREEQQQHKHKAQLQVQIQGEAKTKLEVAPCPDFATKDAEFYRKGILRGQIGGGRVSFRFFWNEETHSLSLFGMVKQNRKQTQQ